MIRRPPRSTLDRSSAASDVYKRQVCDVYQFVRKNYREINRRERFRPVVQHDVKEEWCAQLSVGRRTTNEVIVECRVGVDVNVRNLSRRRHRFTGEKYDKQNQATTNPEHAHTFRWSAGALRSTILSDDEQWGQRPATRRGRR